MKKHTRLTLLFGIVLCHASLSRASDNNNGPYSPAKIVPMATNFASSLIINTIVNMFSQSVMIYIKQAFTTPEPEKYMVETISYNQLQKDGCIKEISNNLPDDLKITLHKNDIHELTLQEKHIHFHETHEENAEIFAQAVAYETHSNFHKIKKDKNNPIVDLNKLSKEIEKISIKTSHGQLATVYIEFNKSELEKNVYSASMIETHKLYAGTLTQAITNLLTKHPNIRLITGACNINSQHLQNQKNDGTDTRYTPIKLQDITTTYQPKHKKLKPQSNDFLIVDSSFATKKRISGYIALTLKKQNDKQPQKNSFLWFLKTAPVYKPIERDHVQDYFYDATKDLSDKELDTYIDHARTIKCNDIEAHRPKTITAAIFSFLSLQPKHDSHLDQINILSEIADKKIAEETQSYSRVPKFTPTQEIKDTFKNVQAIPTLPVQDGLINNQSKLDKEIKPVLKNIPHQYTDDDFENEFKDIVISSVQNRK